MSPLPGQNKPNRQKTRKAEGWRPFCGLVHTLGVAETWDLLQPALFDLRLLSDLTQLTYRSQTQQNLHVSCLDLGSHSSHTRKWIQQNLHVCCLQTSDHKSHVLGIGHNRIFMSRGVKF